MVKQHSSLTVHGQKDLPSSVLNIQNHQEAETHMFNVMNPAKFSQIKNYLLLVSFSQNFPDNSFQIRNFPNSSQIRNYLLLVSNSIHH